MIDVRNSTTQFRLYKGETASLSSTLFDLFPGKNQETRQTKALAYVLSERPILVGDLCQLGPLAAAIQEVAQYRTMVDRLEVDAELTSITGQRADIVVRMYEQGRPILALVIEGKNSGLRNVDRGKIHAQLGGYLDGETYPGLARFPVIGIFLTRYPIIQSDFVSISWNDILDTVENRLARNSSDRLLAQFRDFLTGVDPTMQYEVEVLSVPAQQRGYDGTLSARTADGELERISSRVTIDAGGHPFEGVGVPYNIRVGEFVKASEARTNGRVVPFGTVLASDQLHNENQEHTFEKLGNGGSDEPLFLCRERRGRRCSGPISIAWKNHYAQLEMCTFPIQTRGDPQSMSIDVPVPAGHCLTSASKDPAYMLRHADQAAIPWNLMS